MDSHTAKTRASEYKNRNTHNQISFNRYKKLMLISFPVVVLFCIIGYFAFDLKIAGYCNYLFCNYKIRRTLKDISKLGIATFYLVVSAAVFLFFKFVKKIKIWSNRALLIFMSISLSGILVTIIKFILGRYRPKMFFEEQLYGFEFFQLKGKITSFPSGHASTIVALMLSLYLISPKHRVIYFIIAFIIALSRVAVCHHYLTDVVFGSYVAIITTLCMKHFLDKRGLGIR